MYDKDVWNPSAAIYILTIENCFNNMNYVEIIDINI